MECKIKDKLNIFQFDKGYEIIIKGNRKTDIINSEGKKIDVDVVNTNKKDVINHFEHLINNFTEVKLENFQKQYPKIDDIILNYIRGEELQDSEFKTLRFEIEKCIALYRVKKEETNPTDLKVLRSLKNIYDYLVSKKYK